MTAIDLVIFDCDGVLVDSEPLAMRVMLKMLAEAGLEIDSDTAYDAFLGKSLATVCETLRRDHGFDVDSSALEELRARLNAVLRAELQPIPGIAEALEQLGRPACVASSSQVERIRLSLEVTGLDRFFGDDIFSATMVAHGKPAPDLFLYAAQRMHIDPSRCMVIEDSPAGVTAARAAGMQVLGFAGGGHAQAASHRQKLRALDPAGVFDNMAALPGLLLRLEKDRKVS